jgi:hypothetical protein
LEQLVASVEGIALKLTKIMHQLGTTKNIKKVAITVHVGIHVTLCLLQNKRVGGDKPRRRKSVMVAANGNRMYEKE